MNIYLVRHGEKQDDDKNCDSSELTQKGFQQADLLGKRMKRYNIEKIYTSSMVRAVQTAKEVNKYLNVDIKICPELREICMGDCDTYGWRYLEENYPEFIKEFTQHQKDIAYPPNGECGEDVWKRSKKVIEEIIKSDFKNVAVVAHGGVIRVLISGFLGLSQVKRFSFGSPLVNCSLSVLKYDRINEKFFLQRFNDHAHLEEVVYE